MLETEGLVDISLILGNLVDVYIHYWYKFLIVSLIIDFRREGL